jgi:hypothetical protein
VKNKLQEKPHNIVAKETKNKPQQQAHYTVAKKMKNSHKDDDFASQRRDSNTDYTIKPYTINVDVNPTDSTNSGDSINLDIASEGE